MLTIFTIPKPFSGSTGLIQRNAIGSWLQLRPKCDVILLGDDPGVKDTAESLAVRHIETLERNEFGTPLLASAFRIAEESAKHTIMMYINTDIILFQTLIEALLAIDKPRFLLCGRRWDLDVREEINFQEVDWDQKVLARAKREGRQHGMSGIDYFVFPKDLINMRPFAVGRPGWDSWLIYEMRRRQIPVIDASESVTIVHQNHDYSHSAFGRGTCVTGPELKRNLQLAGGFSCLLTLRDADWNLSRDGLHRPRFPYRLCSVLSQFRIWRELLSAKRQIRERIKAGTFRDFYESR